MRCHWFPDNARSTRVSVERCATESFALPKDLHFPFGKSPGEDAASGGAQVARAGPTLSRAASAPPALAPASFRWCSHAAGPTVPDTISSTPSPRVWARVHHGSGADTSLSTRSSPGALTGRKARRRSQPLTPWALDCLPLASALHRRPSGFADFRLHPFTQIVGRVKMAALEGYAASRQIEKPVRKSRVAGSVLLRCREQRAV